MFDVSIFDIKKVQVIFKEMASSAILPGEDGELTMLDFHEHLISCLKQGMIIVNDRPILKINKGIARMQGNALLILVDR